MRPAKPALTALWHALDEAAFGTEGTLNLRESLPSAVDARARANIWLRARQLTGSNEVLIITGRGNQSPGGVGVIREEILVLLPSLRRRGVVESWKEHSPGSIVVKLASMKTLLGVGRRRRDTPEPLPRESIPQSLAALDPETLRLLRELSIINIESLGVVHVEQFVEQEMVRTFSVLATSIPESPNREDDLREAIIKAIDESSD